MAERRLSPGSRVPELLPLKAPGHEPLLSKEGDMALWIKPESDTRQLGPSVPNLLSDVGSQSTSISGTQVFIYQEGKRAVWQDGSQDPLAM